MKCLRCGYCCTHYLVPIIKDPKLGPVEDNIIIQTGEGPCMHLRGDKPGNYSCAIHHYSWFKDTPCAEFTQVEEKNSECRIGKRILQIRRVK